MICKQLDLKGLVKVVDNKKAFNSIEILFRKPQKFNFSEKFNFVNLDLWADKQRFLRIFKCQVYLDNLNFRPKNLESTIWKLLNFEIRKPQKFDFQKNSKLFIWIFQLKSNNLRELFLPELPGKFEFSRQKS